MNEQKPIVKLTVTKDRRPGHNQRHRLYNIEAPCAKCGRAAVLSFSSLLAAMHVGESVADNLHRLCCERCDIKERWEHDG